MITAQKANFRIEVQALRCFEVRYLYLYISCAAMRKLFYLIPALLFLVFAYFQMNDPDSVPWIIIYLVVSGLFWYGLFGKSNPQAALGVGIILLVGMVLLAGGTWEFFTNEDGISLSEGMQDDYPYIEEAREFGGLAIACLSVFGLWLAWRKEHGRPDNEDGHDEKSI